MIENLEAWLEIILPHYGYIVLFICSLLESIISLSLIVPGSFVLALSGMLAGQGVLMISNVIFVAYLGTIIGDQLSYWIGQSQLIKSVKLNIILSSKEFKSWITGDHLWTFILLAHFSPFLRSFGPGLCGLFKIPYKKWVFLDGFGALIWVICISGVGFLFGVRSKYMGYLQQIGISITLSLLISLVFHIIFKRRKPPVG